MLRLMNHVFTKNLICKQNILINFTFSKNYASFTHILSELQHVSIYLDHPQGFTEHRQSIYKRT